MGKILIKNGKVWDGEKFYYADVLTKDDKINKIEKNILECADYIYDASGKIVSTGFVDAHVHMQGISSEDFGINAEMSSIPFGVTAVADASAIRGSREVLEHILLKNRVFVCSQIKNNQAYFEQAEEMLEKYGDKAIGVKIFFDKKASEVIDGSTLRQVVEFAEKKDLIVLVHSSNAPIPMKEIVEILRPGDILTHAYHGGENNASEDCYECLKKARKKGVIIDAGFAGNVHTDFQVFAKAVKCGEAPDIISTDITRYSAYKRGGRYGMSLCMSLAKHLGMSEEQIFRAITSAPAHALGMENECGTLAVGKKADISIVEYTDETYDLTDAANNHISEDSGYRCLMTIMNGEIVYLR